MTKNSRIYTAIIMMTTLLLSCETEGSTDQPIPEMASLIYPENNTSCLEGEILNELQSKVPFSWQAVDGASYYRIDLIKLSDGSVNSNRSNTNSFELTLLMGEMYSWKVSTYNSEEEYSESETWTFYNAGLGEENHIPFPAEAISPMRGATVVSGQVDLRWSGQDLDNDIRSFEVYTGMDSTALDLYEEVTTTYSYFQTEPGHTYYWKVKTIDAEGNSSMSELFEFKTEN